jgi:hypothetical protein
MKVNDTLWLGSGIYSGPAGPAGSFGAGIPKTPAEIKEFVNNAVTFA